MSPGNCQWPASAASKRKNAADDAAGHVENALPVLNRITAGSHIPGNGRIREVTGGHHTGGNRVHRDTQRAGRTCENTAPTWFGTVRHQVQIRESAGWIRVMAQRVGHLGPKLG